MYIAPTGGVCLLLRQDSGRNIGYRRIDSDDATTRIACTEPDVNTLRGGWKQNIKGGYRMKGVPSVFIGFVLFIFNT
jgi:hypothetical protein